MRSKTNSHLLSAVIAAGTMAVMLAGCSSMPWNKSSGGNFPPPGAAMANGKPTGPPPNVQDCEVIGQGSPNKFICPDGKTYTSFQLSRMRSSYKNNGGGPSESNVSLNGKQQ